MLNEGNQIHNFISSSGSDFLTSYGSGSTTLHITLQPPGIVFLTEANLLHNTPRTSFQIMLQYNFERHKKYVEKQVPVRNTYSWKLAWAPSRTRGTFFTKSSRLTFLGLEKDKTVLKKKKKIAKILIFHENRDLSHPTNIFE